jgi:amino acid transporter
VRSPQRFGNFLIKFAVVLFFLCVVSSGSTWLMGADRAQAIASADGAGPRWLGRFHSKLGTPVNVNLISGLVATITFVAASIAASGDASVAFDVTIGVVLIFTTLSYIVIFPSVIKLRFSHPHINRPYKIPGGMTGVWICGGLTTFWAAFASLVAIFPGLLDGELLNDADLPDGISRAGYTTMTLGAIAVTLAVGALMYYLGTPTRQHLVVDPEVREESVSV